MQSLKKAIFISVVAIIPFTASAAVSDTWKDFFTGAGKSINSIAALFVAIAGLVFMWGVIKLIVHGNEPKARMEGRQFMIFGIVSLGVILTVWGLAGTLRAILFPAIANPSYTPPPLNGQDFKSLVYTFTSVINSAIPAIFGVASLVFIWGVIGFISHGDSPDGRKNGRDFMIYGIIAIAVMLSVWGLAFLVRDLIFPGARNPINPTSSGYDFYKNNGTGEPDSTNPKLNPITGDTDVT